MQRFDRSLTEANGKKRIETEHVEIDQSLSGVCSHMGIMPMAPLRAANLASCCDVASSRMTHSGSHTPPDSRLHRSGPSR